MSQTSTGLSREEKRTGTRPPKPAGALLTRRELAEYLTEVRGRPTSFSTLNKLCALGEGPPVHEWWGPFALYAQEDGDAWSDARASKTRPATRPINAEPSALPEASVAATLPPADFAAPKAHAAQPAERPPSPPQLRRTRRRQLMAVP
jgi:hypothetical protein